MKIAVFGSTGFIGKPLCQSLESRGHSILKLDTRRDLKWRESLQNFDIDAVINLAGAPIFGKRWNDQYKAKIYDSRVDGTREIVEVLGQLRQSTGRPLALIQGSAVGFYGARGDEELTESATTGTDFLSFVCRDWENEAHIAQRQHGIRTVIIRTGVVLGRNGGALEQLLPPFKAFVGGRVGSGRQWFPWIHLDDIVGILVHATEDSKASGIWNGVAPQALRNDEFSKTLAHTLHRPCLFPVPALALYALVGEAAEMLLNGQRVVPQATLESGYTFRFPELPNALKSICS